MEQQMEEKSIHVKKKGTRLTTLVYLEQDGKYLMLYRNKKEHDQSQGKYLGIGGKLEEGESPEECAVREIQEETGLTPLDLRFRGIVTFVSDVWENELMFLYSSSQLSGAVNYDCAEGELVWIETERMLSLPAWEGDKYFLIPILDGRSDIHIKLIYQGERLMEAYDNGTLIFRQDSE